jgi:hypothetical protein
MKPWSFASRLLLALTLLGLVTGPMAASSAVPAMTAQAMASMPDGMPCCPDDKPAVPDCVKDCPLAVLCVASYGSVAPSSTPAFSDQLLAGDVFLHSRDAVLPSLVGEPPPRPPRGLTVIGASSA